MRARVPSTGRALAAVVVAVLASCGPPEPAPLPRVVSAAPVGPGVPPALAFAEVTFTAPVAADELVTGARLVLVPAAALRDALAAVESDEGAGGLVVAVPAAISVEDGGTRAALRPAAALHARTPYALVLSSRLRAADGRAVLDAEGRRRPTVTAFETGTAPGPPPRPVVTEVRVDAATPEAGGEYVELANRGDGALDLASYRLVKRTASGAVSSCALDAPPDIAAGGMALVAGGAWDGRYAVPAGVPVLRCGATALLGGLADDHPPTILLLDPDGVAVTTFGAAGAPLCPAATERLDPDGPDDPSNLGCAEGSPGAL